MRNTKSSIVRPRKTPIRSTDRALIRELFIERVPLYSFADALRLTRMTYVEVEAAISGWRDRDRDHSAGGPSFRGTT